jgi:hypothetical protein
VKGFSLKQITKPPGADKIIKNIEFGIAVGLTRTAKDGQAAVRGALKGHFTLRNQWAEKGPYAIQIKPATKTDLESEVRTRADWLVLHEQGLTKTAKGGRRLAIPTENVRRNKRLIIPKAQRPGALRDKRTFIIKTSKGDVLFQRRGKGKNSKLFALYDLEPKAKIKRVPVFHDPIDKVVKRRLNPNVEAEIRKALATMR